jgi:hypothetical protein
LLALLSRDLWERAVEFENGGVAAYAVGVHEAVELTPATLQ